MLTPNERCESCGEAATTHDNLEDLVPMCDKCFTQLQHDTCTSHGHPVETSGYCYCRNRHYTEAETVHYWGDKAEWQAQQSSGGKERG